MLTLGFQHAALAGKQGGHGGSRSGPPAGGSWSVAGCSKCRWMRCLGAADAESGGRTSKNSAICGKIPVQQKQGIFTDIYRVLLGEDCRGIVVRCW